MPRAYFADQRGAIKDSGKGKVVLLHKFLEQLHGLFPINGQKLGDCVSHGMAGAAQALMATDICVRGERELWKGLVATEPIYAGSRVEVGKGRLGSDDGSMGAWAAKWVTDWGVIIRGKYGTIDLSQYQPSLASKWGMPKAGCPDELEPIAKEHPIKTASLVTTYEQARDAIANGYPVSVASDVGFDDDNRGNANGIRDAEGFLTPRGTWYHQMFFVSVDDAYRRPGLLCVQSWHVAGKPWGSGPKRNDQPDGTFWVDADACDRMLGQQDSFGYSGFEGFPAQALDHMLI
jgi:hypothetical protein